jgi:hypothetical protein
MGSDPTGRSHHRAALGAKRALLRQQTELLGQDLPWLSVPNRIPDEAIGPAGESRDIPYQCFALATWMLVEVVRAAMGVQDRLSWAATLDRHKVPLVLQSRVRRAVLEPTSRHAPGLFAMSEIVAVVPAVAMRESVPPSGWGAIAQRAEKFAARISRDGSDLHVLIRNYLRRPPGSTDGRRELDPTLLRVDAETGVTSVTPIHMLISTAKTAIAQRIGPASGVCAALLAKAPACPYAAAAPTTMYGALWSAYAAAADRLIFQRADLRRMEIPGQAEPDPHFAAALDALARCRASELRLGHPAQTWQAARDGGRRVLSAQARSPRTAAQAELARQVAVLFGSSPAESASDEPVQQDD